MSTDFGKSFKRVGGVALASILMASCSQDWSNSSALTTYDNQTNPYAAGKEKMAAGQYGLAVQSFRRALMNEPGSVKALNALAATYDLLGRFDLAERYYRQALDLNPKSVQSLNNFGYSYYLRGDYARARKLFERAEAIDAGNRVVAANLASVEKAEMKQQIAAAAKRERDMKAAREAATPARTAWIERSDSKVQTLVTKPDTAVIKAVGEGNNEEARVIHTPKPLIEISTLSPERVHTAKPAPVVAAADTKAPSSDMGKNSQPAEVSVASRGPEAANTDDRATAIKSKSAAGNGPETQAAAGSEPAAPAIHADSAAADPIKPAAKNAEEQLAASPTESETPSAPTAPVKPAAKKREEQLAALPTESETPSAPADLPKLKGEAARDVFAAASDADETELAKDASPVPPASDTSSSAVQAPKKMDETVDTAALGDSTQAVVLDPLDPVQEAKVVANPLAVASPDERETVKAVKATDDAPSPVAETAASPAKSVTSSASVAPEEPAAKKAGEQLAAVPTKSETPSAPAGPVKPAAKKAGDDLAALDEAGRIEISNGAGRLAMAARMGRYLSGHGVKSYNLTNAESYTNKVSVLYFKPGNVANAKSLSGLLPVQPDLRSNKNLRTDLRLVLGGDLLDFDRNLISKYK